MNEPTGATQMLDSSGNGLTGALGDEVTTGNATGDGGLAYRFPGPAFAEFNPEKLVLVPDDPRLDPGTEPYAVTIRLRTTAAQPNIVQKGQNNQRGGFWKLVLKNGWPRCHYEDETGAVKAIGFVGGLPEHKVNDGQWHVLRCERLANGVRVTMDPGTPEAASRFISGRLGRIDNSRPFMIGGKLDCASPQVGCDFYNGQLDYVRVEKGVIPPL